MTADLRDDVRGLLDEAAAAFAGSPSVGPVVVARDQLDGALRVAFAGRLKAGKSTLLNAVVGERLAATDATECTKVVTWYVAGPATRAWAHVPDAPPRQLRYTRDEAGTHLDLGGLAAQDVDRLEVETPSARLDRLTLVDTPGLASVTEGVSVRTERLMVDDGPGVDAVIYLMRHVHTADVGFLQSFHDDQFAGTAPVNAIGVLSRADEMAGGQGGSLEVARTIADRYGDDPRVRAVVQTVVPVSGLLALAAMGLTESRFASLAALSRAPASSTISADRLLRADLDVPREERERLLAELGMFGIRYATGLVAQGVVDGAAGLARHLQAVCGLEEVRALLLERFLLRAGLLKADAALRVLEAAVDAHPGPAADALRRRVEAVVAGAHELVELRTLTALRTGDLELDDPAWLADAERLLGVAGTSRAARLGLPDDAPPEDVRAAAVARVRHWQRLSQHPFAGGGTRRVADVVRRTCEGML